jgi:hypothetical protein
MPMVASSPVRNDINNLGAPNQVEIQQSAAAYQSSSLAWKTMTEFNLHGMGDGQMMHQQMHSASYDHMNFGSDEEDCFDQLSDQGGDDSEESSGGLDDSRIQQL